VETGVLVPGEPITTAALSELVTADTPEYLSGLPPVLQEAIQGFGLKRDNVLSHRIRPEGGCVIVTRGGRKLAWPDDAGRNLTDAERGTAVPNAPRFFPKDFLERGPKKD
jgi:hypothetical protein